MSAPSGLDAAELYRLTGGNPFFVIEVLQAGMPEVPAAARDAVLARTARLSAEARDLLDVAALIGTRIEPELIEATAPGSLALVDEILASGLLTEDGRRLRFRHEIARLTVEQTIRAHRRGGIHDRILGALHALGCTDDARLAFHAEGVNDGAAVLRYAPAAAYGALASNRMLCGKYADAISLAEQAAELAESTGARGVLSDALNTLGAAQAADGGDWAGPLRRALALAVAANLHEQAGRAYANIHYTYLAALGAALLALGATATAAMAMEVPPFVGGPVTGTQPANGGGPPVPANRPRSAAA